eukprot:669980-Amphidinium_carterae.1
MKGDQEVAVVHNGLALQNAPDELKGARGSSVYGLPCTFLLSRGLGLVMICSDLPWRLQKTSPSYTVETRIVTNRPTMSYIGLIWMLASFLALITMCNFDAIDLQVTASPSCSHGQHQYIMLHRHIENY